MALRPLLPADLKRLRPRALRGRACRAPNPQAVSALSQLKTRPAKSWGSGGELKLVIIGPRPFNWLWQSAITFETSVEMSGPDVEHQLSA